MTLATLLVTPALAKDKNKRLLPAYLLHARTVRVLIDPDAGESLDQPYSNSIARESVEKALLEWGRAIDAWLQGESGEQAAPTLECGD